jgi:hypothetical protein
VLLPINIRGLADDPYRGLAWAVREAGGFEKTGEPFCEFRWADFLRKRIRMARTEGAFEEALKEALALAATPEAKHLPGYRAKGTGKGIKE